MLHDCFPVSTIHLLCSLDELTRSPAPRILNEAKATDTLESRFAVVSFFVCLDFGCVFPGLEQRQSAFNLSHSSM